MALFRFKLGGWLENADGPEALRLFVRWTPPRLSVAWVVWVTVQASAWVYLSAVAMDVNALLGSVMAWLAQRLPIALVIEQHRVTSMRDNVVDDSCYRQLPFLLAHCANRMALQEVLRPDAPAMVIASSGCAQSRHATARCGCRDIRCRRTISSRRRST